MDGQYNTWVKRVFDILTTKHYHVIGQIFEGRLFLHLKDLKKFSKDVYKEGLLSVSIIKEQARKNGYDSIWAAILYDDKKLLKFETMLGFEPHLIHNGVLYMVQDT